MSSTHDEYMEAIADPRNPNRYNQFAAGTLGVLPAETQERILRGIAEHRYLQIQSANGVGKTFALALAKLGFLYANAEPAICYTTSGTYDTLEDTLWKPMRSLWGNANRPLPGQDKNSPPRIEDIPGRPESYFKARSPKHAGSLEGRHGARMLVSVEEADKPDIDMDIIHSMETNVTDTNDRMVVIGNPPDDETGVMYELRESEKYHTIQFSAFESHNIANGYEEGEDGYIPGLVAPSKIRERWQDYNGEEWPGLEAAATAHERRDDLGKRWYKRVAGVIPSSQADVYRPYHVDTVEAAYTELTTSLGELPPPDGTGLDVARSGDRTVAATVHGDILAYHYAKRGTHHTQQEADLRSHYREFDTHRIAGDAVGEGSGLIDGLGDALPDVVRFGSGKEATDPGTYRDYWTEALCHFGSWLEDSGRVCVIGPDAEITHADVREELIAGARVVELTERHLKSRATDKILEATSKSAIKDHLGHSPDLLDAALMAIWASVVSPAQAPDDVPLTW